MATACRPDLRLIGAQEPTLPGRYTPLRLEADRKWLQRGGQPLLPGIPPRCPSVAPQREAHGLPGGSPPSTSWDALLGYRGRHVMAGAAMAHSRSGHCSLGPLGFQPPGGFLASRSPHCPRQEVPEHRALQEQPSTSAWQNLEL